MWLRICGHLIAHPGTQSKFSTVFQLCQQFAFQDQQDMAPRAPVVGKIAWRVFNVPNANIANLNGSPNCNPSLPGMVNFRDQTPVSSHEGNILDFHVKKHSEIHLRGPAASFGKSHLTAKIVTRLPQSVIPRVLSEYRVPTDFAQFAVPNQRSAQDEDRPPPLIPGSQSRDLLKSTPSV